MKFLEESSLYLSSNIISVIIGVLALPVLTRLLTPSDFGILALFLVFGQIIVGIISFNLSTASYKYYFEYKNKLSEYKILHTSNIICNLCVFLIFGIIVFYLSDFISNYIFKKNLRSDYVVISFLNACFIYFLVYFKQLHIAAHKVKLYVFITIFEPISRIAITVIMITNYSFKYEALIAGHIISNIIILIILTVSMRKLFVCRLNSKYLKKSFMLSSPEILTKIIGLIYSSFDKVMINNISGATAVGHYSFGSKFGDFIKIVINSLGNSFGPYFQAHDINSCKSNEQIIKKYNVITYLIFAIAFGIILFSEEIVITLTTKDYYESMYIIPIYIFYHLFGVIGILATNQLLKAEQLKYEIPSAALSLSINLVLNLILIPIYGIIGAAIATMIAAFVNNIVLAYYAFKVYPISEYRSGKLILLYIASIILMGLSYLMMNLDINILTKIIFKLALLIAIIIAVNRAYGINLHTFAKLKNL